MGTNCMQAFATRGPLMVRDVVLRVSFADILIAGIGRIEQIANVECYIAEPLGEGSQEKAILFLTDAYGHKFVNNQVGESPGICAVIGILSHVLLQLLADDFARNGYHVIVPDLFQNDAVPSFVPPDASISKEEFDVAAWVERHPPEIVQGIVAQVVTALRERGVKKFAALGYCFGARIAIDLASAEATSVCVVSHPSFWKVPDDMERYLVESKAPLLINSCEVDAMFPKEAQEKVDAILGGGRFKPGYERTYWQGCMHGFAVRGDMVRQPSTAPFLG
ncbi:alpha/beta-hydrolase [Rhodofomes roseus]|uniref:Alpha/beta-hydrolase n=1 Tax=Rhodofomes roseus TaxID=34475 RepID=A0ABQ8KNP1_9APHY|nr:alpha/beta-hydrolase [Rhodofomes roseus]KAH9840049.1 alpha/beta-hydrolase [Rhodofomes roseus]